MELVGKKFKVKDWEDDIYTIEKSSKYGMYNITWTETVEDELEEMETPYSKEDAEQFIKEGFWILEN